MPLSIMVNSAWENTCQIVATDSANATTGEDSNVGNVAGGSPYIFWQGATAERRIAYVNKLSNLSSSHFILTRADRHVGHQIDLYKYATWSSSGTLVTSTANPLATGTLIGQNSQDLILTCAASNVEALQASFASGTGGVYTKYVHQAYFANELILAFPNEYIRRPLPLGTRKGYRNRSFLVDYEWNFTAEDISRTDKQTFERLFNLKQEPFFIYDPDGYIISFKLLHCFFGAAKFVSIGDDKFNLELQVFQLRRWS